MSGTKPSSYWSTSHAYPYPWDRVATFYWSRYPNPNSAHVFSEDIIECGVGVDGVLRTKRLIVKTNKLPWWGKHLFSAKKVAVVEETLVDPTSRLMTTYTRNIGLTIFMGTTEKNFYRPGISDSSEEESTVCEKNVWITSDIVGLRSAIRKFGVDRFKANCVRASDGLLWAIRENQLNSRTKTCDKDTASVTHPNSSLTPVQGHSSTSGVPSSVTQNASQFRTANFITTGGRLPN